MCFSHHLLEKKTKAEMLDMRALRANERKYDEHPMVKITRIKAF